MALNKEIWIADIVEGFFPANDFVTKSVDHSAYVNNKTVHVPNGGLPPEIKVNPASFPIAASKRTDSDLTYNIDTFCSVPIHIQNAEVAELSYNKRQSVIGQMRQELQRVVSEAILSNWVPSSPFTLETSGAAVAAHISAATGNRKAFAINDVKKLKLMFDKEDLPSTGRYILLDANMYNDLMGEMTDGVKMNFLSGADPTSGIVGRFMGFDFLMRSKVLKTNQSGALKAWSASGAATDCAAGLAWHRDSVARALGSVTMFTNDQDPQYYGDIMSCEVRAGGACCRSDKKGVVLIYEGTEA